jgi:hypothetical protein
MTAEEQEAARAALVRIATDNEKTATGHRKRLARETAIRIARETCLRLGWDFSGNRAK